MSVVSTFDGNFPQYVPVTETVHHDAVYKDQTITIVDKEEWDEYLYTECTTCGASKQIGNN